MLEQYLFSRFEVSALRANVPENEGQFLQNVYKPAFHYGGPGKFAFSRKMQEDLILLDNYTDFRLEITSSWAKYCVGQGDFLIEKSPPNLTNFLKLNIQQMKMSTKSECLTLSQIKIPNTFLSIITDIEHCLNHTNKILFPLTPVIKKVQSDEV